MYYHLTKGPRIPLPTSAVPLRCKYRTLAFADDKMKQQQKDKNETSTLILNQQCFWIAPDIIWTQHSWRKQRRLSTHLSHEGLVRGARAYLWFQFQTTALNGWKSCFYSCQVDHSVAVTDDFCDYLVEQSLQCPNTGNDTSHVTAVYF